MIRQFELVELVRAYHPSADEALLNKAYVFAVRAHGGQTRASGEPYFNHPVEVAAILTELRLDDATIATALLHDTIEDTDVSFADIEAGFGAEIAQLVEGVTKLSKLRLSSKEAAQAENFRKLLVAMARDPRVLLVKMADRLHNMRTLEHLRPEKRARIAHETMEIFAPLAGRMGMQSIRDELEDLAFSVLNPEARLSILRRFVHLKQSSGDSLAPEVVAALKEILALDGVEAAVSGREKRPFAVWRKMQRKDVSFEQLSDIVAFRVLVADEAACYRALGSVHTAFRAVPGRFKDYISGPKANGYRSIHTTVIGPRGARIEIQIRTHQMHEVAETGVAAHWAYKNGSRNDNPFAVDPFRWLRDLVDRVERGEPAAEDPGAFLEDAKLEMSFDQVFCFTPKGDVIGLPREATPLDLAYAIHTELGHSAVGAKINGKRAPLWRQLRNGETVEILQSDGQRPSPIWLEMVKTGRARSAIRRAILAQERDDAAALGAKITQRAFERAGVAFSAKAVDAGAAKLGLPDGGTALAEVGRARLAAAQLLEAVYPEQAAEPGAAEGREPLDPNRPQVIPTVVMARRDGVEAEASDNGALSIPVAPCCRPLPGERIVAIREPRIGFRLHAIHCAMLERFEDAMERWLDVSWAPDAGDRADHVATASLVIANEPGALGQVCTLIGHSGVNIDDMTFVDRKPDYFQLDVDMEVRDVRHLNNVLTALNAQPVVAEARRIRAKPARLGGPPDANPTAQAAPDAGDPRQAAPADKAGAAEEKPGADGAAGDGTEAAPRQATLH